MEIRPKNVRLRYSEFFPPENLSHLVFCYFEFTIDGMDHAPIPHEVFPDGCISLLYRRNTRLGLNLLLLKGLSLKTFHTHVFADDRHWGVKLLPAACEKILRCDPETIPTQPIADISILPHLTRDLAPKLNRSKNFKESISVFENKLENLQIEKSEVDAKIARAVKMKWNWKSNKNLIT